MQFTVVELADRMEELRKIYLENFVLKYSWNIGKGKVRYI